MLKTPQAWLSAYMRHTGPITLVAALVLTLALARLLAKLVWALVPLPASAQWQAPPAPPPAVSARPADANALVSAALFGRYQPPKDPNAQALDHAPETQLSLTLLGIYATDAKHSRALISKQAGDEHPYSIGQTITAGATLQAIFPDKVVLSRNGRLETLLLDKNRPSKSTAPAVTDDEESSDDDEDANATGLARIRNEILSDPGKAQEYIRVQPVNTNGTTKGYRVYPGRNRDLFNEAGLRPGDLVTSINGVDLTDTARSMQLLADLAQVEDLTVVVDRGGQSQSIHVSLGQ